MPWQEMSVMDQRTRMVRKWESGLYTPTELAAEFGVSRPTVYKWLVRYVEEHEIGLVDRAPVPKTFPHRTAGDIAAQIVSAKLEHPLWGPSKLIDLLRVDRPDVDWPATSTAGRILDGVGLVAKGNRRRSGVVRRYVNKATATESGEMMTADHKGEFLLQNAQYCYPVTVCDPVSKFIYAIDGKTSTSHAEAKTTFERIFKEHGIPEFILTDNGNPFSCSRSVGALSRMAVWWIKIGIAPLTIHPGCPWENGSHERMHKTLKAATTRPPARTMRGQQKSFDDFQLEFNTVRPHQSLQGRRPAELLKPCKRSFPRRIPPIEYPNHYETRSVGSKGAIKWRGGSIFISESLAGERVGLVEVDDGVFSVYFSSIELARYDDRTKRILA